VNTAAIILAAGESSRMGRPKALLPFRGGTFLSVLAKTFGARCSPVVAVFGAGAESLIPAAPAGVVPVTNPDYKLGMLTSLQAGLRALAPESRERVLFTLVDHPAIEVSTVDALIQSRAPIAIPRCSGRRGHPVAIRQTVIDEILAEPATSKIHDIINRHAASVEYVEVDDPGIHDDIDDSDAYRELMLRESEPA
jgi:molybdenum cofactor cytidylyltransferase